MEPGQTQSLAVDSILLLQRRRVRKDRDESRHLGDYFNTLKKQHRTRKEEMADGSHRRVIVMCWDAGDELSLLKDYSSDFLERKPEDIKLWDLQLWSPVLKRFGD
ncbi:hypothetical protein B0T20DRAFT_477584 [Sordaria brevicollis]|uniref:Uncharacterized protein n=1 Tax=Sordaria brevicollis TaxID=83679 RepID=A0AAE0UD58_SORBR|nr:hypothetical protein B0T20DRAFT_477584 [Sordaria brevicollis]